MANLRADLLNELRNQKYYAEIELVRLAQDDKMNYRNKISVLDKLLGDIALLNIKMELANNYFQAPEAQPVAQEGLPVPAPAPEAAQPVQPVQTIVHKGQSHGE